MAHGTLKDYVQKLGLFPCYKTPEYLGADIEFAYFEFIVPHAYRAENCRDLSGALPEAWFLDMIYLPVYTGVEQLKRDDTFTFFKCRVPLCIMKSPFGMGYFAPQMKVSNEMPLPSPDHEKAIDKAFKKAKEEPAPPDNSQWELKLKCDCGRETIEIHKTATEGLVARYCGKCNNTKLQLVSLRPIKPKDD